MSYGDNVHKQLGIQREPIVAQRILEYFKAQKLQVVMERQR